MKLIKLSQGYFAQVDDSDFDRVNSFKWSVRKSYNNIYAVTRVGKKQVRMHRFILNLTNKNILADHRDNNGLNNQKLNLRVCTNGENLCNRRVSINKKSSKFLGVFFYKNKWIAGLRKKGNLKRIVCSTELEAAKTYNELATKYHGEFASLNHL